MRPLAPACGNLWKKVPSPYTTPMIHRILLAVLLVTALAGGLGAQATAPRVTTPQQEFGHNFGDDYFLANYKQLAAYWHKLDKESDRMTVAVDRQDRRGARSADGDRDVAREPSEPRQVQGHLAAAGPRRGAHRRAGARAREGRQSHRLDRRRPACQRDARRPAARRDGLSDGQPHRRRDDAVPGRRDHPVRAREPGRQRSGRRLVHADAGPEGTIVRGPAAAVPEVHRPRQQPRLLRLDAGREREHEPGPVPRVVPADPVQPPSERSGRHDSLVAAAPRSVQLQPGPAARARHPDDRPRAAYAARGRRQAGRHHAVGRAVRRVVERRHPEHRGVPQHDRDPDRDDRQPDPDARAARDEPAAAVERSDVPGAAAGVALPAVGGLLGDLQSRRARHGVEDEGELSLQPLRDGQELRRTGEPRHVDGTAASLRRRSGGDGPRVRSRRRGGRGRSRRRGVGRGRRGALGRAPQAGGSRSARLRHPVVTGRFLDRDAVRERAPRDGHHREPRDARLHGRREAVPSRVVRDLHGAGVPPARDRHVRTAGSPRQLSVSGRAADPAVRQRGLDARVPDGHRIRSAPRAGYRSLRTDSGLEPEDAGGRRAAGRRVAGHDESCPARRVRGRQSPAGCQRRRVPRSRTDSSWSR